MIQNQSDKIESKQKLSADYLKGELYALIKKDDSIFDFIMENGYDGLWFWDLNNLEKDWKNPKFLNTIGYDFEEMLNTISIKQDVINKEDLKLIFGNLAKHLKDSSYSFDQILRYKHKLGHIVSMKCKGLVVLDNADKPSRILLAHRLITNLDGIEIELQNKVVCYRHIIESTNLGTWEWNVKTGETIFNERWAEIIGYDLSELGSISIDTWIKYSHPDDLEKSNELLQEHFKGDTPFYECEARMKHKDGHWIWVLDRGKVISWDTEGNPEWMTGSHQEITENKEAFTTLENIIDDITQVSIIGTDKNGLITTFNKGAENLLGYAKQEVIFKESVEILHLEEEMTYRRDELSSLLGYEIEGFDVFTTLLEKEEYDTREWTHVRKDGGTFPVQVTLSPIRNNNEITGYLGVATDISEIKKVEKELKSLLAVAEDQNRRLKNFAHIVSHNLKSHSGNFEMLLELFVQENPGIEENEIIKLFKTASEHLTETIVHLNEVVLMNTSVNENMIGLNLREAANRTIESISAFAIETDVTIHNQINHEVRILGIPAYLDSILLNFITNGIKYSTDKKDSYIALKSYLEKEYVVLVIEDNGLGIDLKKHRAKLFGMYKTFHNKKDSRGIGLFITKNQVEAIGGKIEVKSKVNEGTTFKIYMKHEKN
ncbi:PAS domain-containing protein [Aquimarina sp. 2201CG5-10]|uniref:PAS domain-containing sensor histidine kinase n=1 Tax=Aquimarina callyspongiae TaxID=3098150 RepID=UPI002AB43983|nr:PAS domain-containing protein [Aquimarina sp. 2201CG5-10]MDY8136512.1 PAS domain-containing protein [Aquimarina sp. 2201CG5-10]